MTTTLKPDVKVIANAARELLNRGDVEGAEKVLTPVFNELWGDASVWHLMGLIKQAQRRFPEAERCLRRAVADALTEGTYYNDLGVVLQARGEYAEALKVYRASIALTPVRAACRVNLVHCLMSMGDYAEAERESRAFIDALPGPEGWTLLGQVQRTQGRFEDALASAEEALRFAPGMRGLRHNRAIALDRLGRTEEALAAFEQLARADLETPELALNFARALYRRERIEDAEHVLGECIKFWPQTSEAYLMLARMRLQRGLGDMAAAPMEEAIAAQPQNWQLLLRCADFLHRAGYDERALTLLEAGLRASPNAPSLLLALGIVLDALDRSDAALRALREADARSGGAVEIKRALIPPLLRTGQASEALQIARALRRESLRDQALLASEAMALRVLGDPEYATLCNYQRQVRVYDLAPPDGYFTIANFNAALAESLRGQLDRSSTLDATLPGAVQTLRDLRQINETNFRDFFAAIDAPLRRYISTLDANDPAGRRRSNGYKLKAAWATMLGQGGSVPNHVHDTGWLCALYIVEAPKTEGRSGWIKIGEPFWPIRGCGPERWIEPKAGSLILMPCYFWHGVERLTGEGERLSIGVDIMPA